MIDHALQYRRYCRVYPRHKRCASNRLMRMMVYIVLLMLLLLMESSVSAMCIKKIMRSGKFRRGDSDHENFHLLQTDQSTSDNEDVSAELHSKEKISPLIDVPIPLEDQECFSSLEIMRSGKFRRGDSDHENFHILDVWAKLHSKEKTSPLIDVPTSLKDLISLDELEECWKTLPIFTTSSNFVKELLESFKSSETGSPEREELLRLLQSSPRALWPKQALWILKQHGLLKKMQRVFLGRENKALSRSQEFAKDVFEEVFFRNVDESTWDTSLVKDMMIVLESHEEMWFLSSRIQHGTSVQQLLELWRAFGSRLMTLLIVSAGESEELFPQVYGTACVVCREDKDIAELLGTNEAVDVVVDMILEGTQSLQDRVNLWHIILSYDMERIYRAFSVRPTMSFVSTMQGLLDLSLECARHDLMVMRMEMEMGKQIFNGIFVDVFHQERQALGNADFKTSRSQWFYKLLLLHQHLGDAVSTDSLRTLVYYGHFDAICEFMESIPSLETKKTVIVKAGLDGVDLSTYTREQVNNIVKSLSK